VKPANISLTEDATPLSERIGRTLDVSFNGEPARGPGVLREFLTLGLSSLMTPNALEAPLWEYTPELRTYWFAEPEDLEGAASGYRACGAVLGHAILQDCFLTPAFPKAVYTLLLRNLGEASNSQLRPWTGQDLARVSPSIASGLEALVEYDKDDLCEMFPLDWPRAGELEGLNKDGRVAYVQAYIEWYFTHRFSAQIKPFTEGFSAVVGHSKLLQLLVSAEQLEQILCGVEQPLEVGEVRLAARPNGWGEDDGTYLDDFWSVVEVSKYFNGPLYWWNLRRVRLIPSITTPNLIRNP